MKSALSWLGGVISALSKKSEEPASVEARPKTIYVLGLEEAKFYVGITADFNARYSKHCSGAGSFWTKKYSPIRILKTFEGDEFDELAETLRMMSMYGVNNVRGGPFCQIEFDDEGILNIYRMMWSCTGMCNRCGRDSHMVMNCQEVDTINGIKLEIERATETPRKFKPKGMFCTRCKRNNHFANGCFAKTQLDGTPL